MKTHGPHVFGAESDPILERLALGNGFARGGVGDDTGAYLLENAVGHGVVEQSADIPLVDIDGL